MKITFIFSIEKIIFKGNEPRKSRSFSWNEV